MFYGLNNLTPFDEGRRGQGNLRRFCGGRDQKSERTSPEVSKQAKAKPASSSKQCGTDSKARITDTKNTEPERVRRTDTAVQTLLFWAGIDCGSKQEIKKHPVSEKD